MTNFEMFFARTFHLKHKDPSDLHKHLTIIISDKILSSGQQKLCQNCATKLTPISVQNPSFSIATIMSPHFDGLLRITE